MAHVVAFGQDSGRGSLWMVAAHGACFLNAIQQPPPLWVVWIGSLAFWELLWGRRGVHRVVMCLVAYDVEDVSERPVVWVHRCLREQGGVRFVEVKNSD